VDRHDLIRGTGKGAEAQQIRPVAGQQHPIAISATDDAAGIHGAKALAEWNRER
jgi:hypothetical protein